MKLTALGLLLLLHSFVWQADPSPQATTPIVYVTEPANQSSGEPDFDLYVMNPENGTIIFKSATAYQDCPLTLSPDGEWLLYQQDFVENKQLKLVHKLVNLITGHQYQIDLGNQLLSKSSVLWVANRGDFFFIVNNYNDNTIYRYDLDAGKLTDVVHSKPFIRLEQIGQNTAYWSANDNKLTVNFLEGKEYTFQYSNLYTMGTPSPDGRNIVVEVEAEKYTDERGLIIDKLDYRIISLNQENSLTISDAYRGSTLFHLVWRPDSQAVFYYDLDKNFVVYDLIHSQKSLFRSSVMPSLFDHMSGYWSPDGRFIAYTIDFGSVSHKDDHEIGLIDTATRQISKVITYNDFQNQAGFLQWISNHEFVFINGSYGGNVVSLRKTEGDIFKYDVVTQTFKQLTNTPNLIEKSSCHWG